MKLAATIVESESDDETNGESGESEERWRRTQDPRISWDVLPIRLAPYCDLKACRVGKLALGAGKKPVPVRRKLL